MADEPIAQAGIEPGQSDPQNPATEPGPEDGAAGAAEPGAAEPGAAEPGAAEPDGDGGDGQPQDPYKPRGVQKRIDELTRQKYEAQAAAERERQAREELERRIAAREQQAPPPPTRPKPTLESCDWDNERFADELTDWKLEQREAARHRDIQQRQLSEQQQQRREYIGTVNQRGAKEFPDYETKVLKNPDLRVSEEMALAMAAAEQGHKVAYFLGNNPGEAARIATLHPIQQAIEIGRIEARLTSSPAKKTTSAPPPITPVAARNSSTDTGLDDNLPVDEWIRRRNAQVGKR